MDIVKLLQSMTDAEKDEVVKALEKEKKEKEKKEKSKWTTRPAVGERYWYVSAYLDVRDSLYDDAEFDNYMIELGVCTDKQIMENRAFTEKLSRALWKFKLENDNVELDWEDNEQCKWYVVFVSDVLCVEATCTEFIAGVTYFSTKKIAERAIKEVVEPMLNMEM